MSRTSKVVWPTLFTRCVSGCFAQGRAETSPVFANSGRDGSWPGTSLRTVASLKRTTALSWS